MTGFHTNLIAQTDTITVRRSLRRHGFTISARSFIDLVAAGNSPERNDLTTQLVACSNDDGIKSVLVAAYGGYVAAWQRDTRNRPQGLSEEDLWSLGIEALCSAINAARRCGGGALHLIRSSRRDFVRSVQRHRRNVQAIPSDLVIAEETGQKPAPPTLTGVEVEELVDWLATELDAREEVARMLVATRLGGFPLAPKDDALGRARNCKTRRRLENKLRARVSPTEGLAERVLSLAS